MKTSHSLQRLHQAPMADSVQVNVTEQGTEQNA